MSKWFNSIVPDLVSGEFTAIVNIVSIIGFFITVFVMINVRQIKGQYTSRIRVPELRVNLEEHTSKIGDLLNDYSNNKHNISLELTRTEPVLQAIKKRLGWTERSKVKESIKIIKIIQKTKPISSEDDFRNIYDRLHGINSELEQWENDMKWSA